KTPLLLSLAAAAFVGIFFLGLPFPLIVAEAALVGYFVAREAPNQLGLATKVDTVAPPAEDRWRRFAIASVVGLVAWGTPIAFAAFGLGRRTSSSASGLSSRNSPLSVSAAPMPCWPTWRRRLCRLTAGCLRRKWSTVSALRKRRPGPSSSSRNLSASSLLSATRLPFRPLLPVFWARL